MVRSESVDRVSLALSCFFVLLVAVVFCGRPVADDATNAGDAKNGLQKKPIDGQPWPPTDPVKFLQQLQQRDTALQNRILTVEERWVEHIDPRAIQARQQFTDVKFGQTKNTYPKPDTLPDAYDQPHRRVTELIVRDEGMTIKIKAELEQRLNSEYGIIDNTGAISTNVGGVHRSYSPVTGSTHIMGSRGGVQRSRRLAFEWCTGHGFARLMTSIESITMKDDRVIVKGGGAVFDIKNTTFELEIDRDLIVRRAVMTVPSGPNGFNDYRITTEGTVKPAGAPAVANKGISQRVLRPLGKPERDSTKYDIAFVSLSEPLSDDEYAKVVAFEPKPGARRVDVRPLEEREAN